MPDSQVDTDALLVERAKNGDTQAFGELHDKYAEAIFRFPFARLANRMDAEDLTNDVFLRAWRALPGYQHKGYPFSAFLFRIARNLLTDYYRSSKRAEQLQEFDERLLQGQDGSPMDMIIAQQEYQKLHQALETIRADYRDVIILRFISGLSPDETAKVMGRSPGAARVLQHRALNALRKQLEKIQVD